MEPLYSILANSKGLNCLILKIFLKLHFETVYLKEAPHEKKSSTKMHAKCPSMPRVEKGIYLVVDSPSMTLSEHKERE